MLVKIMPVIVHIGYPKTATTWLQKRYFPNIKNFNYISFLEVNKLFIDTDFFTFNAQNTRMELLANSKDGNLLLSSEFITTAINAHWHHGYYSAGVAQKIHATFPDATIVVFIRRQQSLICSAYQQYLKNGGTYGFRRWLYSGDVFCSEHLYYDRMVEFYDNLFGEKQVRVYFYEDFKEDSNGFLTSLNNDLGLVVDMNSISLKPENVGLRRMIIPLLFLVNHFYKKPIGLKRYIIHVPGMTSVGKGIYKFINPFPLFGNFLSEDKMLKPKDKLKLHDFYSESNRRLANRVGLERLNHHGYYL